MSYRKTYVRNKKLKIFNLLSWVNKIETHTQKEKNFVKIAVIWHNQKEKYRFGLG